MGHISRLGLFDHLSGRADLPTQELEHLKDCDDCRDEAVELRRVIDDSGDIQKTRLYLAEHGELPTAGEAPKEVHEEQRELDERPG